MLDWEKTPEVYDNIAKTTVLTNKKNKIKDFKTVLIVPEKQVTFSPTSYHT